MHNSDQLIALAHAPKNVAPNKSPTQKSQQLSLERTGSCKYAYPRALPVNVAAAYESISRSVVICVYCQPKPKLPMIEPHKRCRRLGRFLRHIEVSLLCVGAGCSTPVELMREVFRMPFNVNRCMHIYTCIRRRRRDPG